MRVAEILHTMEYGPAPESAAPATAWLDAHARRFGMFIDGKWTTPGDERLFDTVNPANGQPFAKLTQASETELDAAVAAARRAFAGWSQASGHTRARYMYALARQIQKHARRLAVLETIDNGKPIRETRDIDIPLVARHFYHHAGWAQLMDTQLAGYAPLGVVGQIIPWNFPLLMLAWKIAPALAMGNTVVLKPAEWTSLTALAFAEICQEIGLPPGVVNIVHGPGDSTGSALVAHRKVKRIGFTGSVATGRVIQRLAAEAGVKHVSLELGGKNPMIIFPDIGPARAAEIAVAGMNFAWAGQSCGSTSRVLVHESIYEDVVMRIAALVDSLVVGDPLDQASQMGPVNSAAHLARIEQHVAWAHADGARMVAGGGPAGTLPVDGFWIRPAAFADVTPDMRIAQQEIFGPVMAIMKWQTEEEALALANGTEMGLTASVWTNRLDAALRFARELESGYVWINGSSTHFPGMPFSGRKESGVGSEEGLEELLSYTETKAVHFVTRIAQ